MKASSSAWFWRALSDVKRYNSENWTSTDAYVVEPYCNRLIYALYLYFPLNTMYYHVLPASCGLAHSCWVFSCIYMIYIIKIIPIECLMAVCNKELALCNQTRKAKSFHLVLKSRSSSCPTWRVSVLQISTSARMHHSTIVRILLLPYVWTRMDRLVANVTLGLMETVAYVKVSQV